MCAIEGDRERATDYWQRALAQGGAAAWSAALGLGTLAAFDADDARARNLLDRAGEGGIATAVLCRDSLASDATVRAEALDRLAEREEDTDALNFLGIAALRSGDRAAAAGRWTEAARLHDAVAPLLVALIEAPR